ncbi:MAG: diguanylate cyclase [Firmicutes bacterium]|nr:diguanylate cyclase [Bacillota bacterium]
MASGVSSRGRGPASVERRVLRLLVFVAAALVLTVVMIVSRSVAVSQAQNSVSNDTRIIVDDDNVLIALLNMETGQRGYLLTGRAAYLQPYDLGREQAVRALADLSRRLGPYVSRQVQLHALSALIAAKESELAATIGLRRSQGYRAALTLVDTNAGQLDMDTIRQRLASLKQMVLQRVERERLLASSAQTQSTIWPALGAVLFLALLTLSYTQLRRDIRDKQELTTRLEYESSHDALTKLSNRRYFIQQLGKAITEAERSGYKLALLFIDLDGFKPLNDSLGHEAGDRALRLTGELFGQIKREQDLVARLGGDEFAMLIPLQDEAVTTEDMAMRLLACYALDDVRRLCPRLGASVGVAVFPDDAQTSGELLKAADQAMYRAKAAGGGRVERFHAPSL